MKYFLILSFITILNVGDTLAFSINVNEKCYSESINSGFKVLQNGILGAVGGKCFLHVSCLSGFYAVTLQFRCKQGSLIFQSEIADKSKFRVGSVAVRGMDMYFTVFDSPGKPSLSSRILKLNSQSRKTDVIETSLDSYLEIKESEESNKQLDVFRYIPEKCKGGTKFYPAWSGCYKKVKYKVI